MTWKLESINQTIDAADLQLLFSVIKWDTVGWLANDELCVCVYSILNTSCWTTQKIEQPHGSRRWTPAMSYASTTKVNLATTTSKWLQQRWLASLPVATKYFVKSTPKNMLMELDFQQSFSGLCSVSSFSVRIRYTIAYVHAMRLKSMVATRWPASQQSYLYISRRHTIC